MSGIPTHDSTQHAKSEFEPNTTPRGTPIPFRAEIFGNTSHIATSIPVVEATSHVHPRPVVIIPIRIPEPRRVTIGNTTYITSRVPPSSIPPPHSHGPSSQNVATSHVRTAATRVVMSQSQVPLVV